MARVGGLWNGYCISVGLTTFHDSPLFFSFMLLWVGCLLGLTGEDCWVGSGTTDGLVRLFDESHDAT